MKLIIEFEVPDGMSADDLTEKIKFTKKSGIKLVNAVEYKKPKPAPEPVRAMPNGQKPYQVILKSTKGHRKVNVYAFDKRDAERQVIAMKLPGRVLSTKERNKN